MKRTPKPPSPPFKDEVAVTRAPTPAVDWEPIRPPPVSRPSVSAPLSSQRLPGADRALEADLRDQILTGLSGQHVAAEPTQVTRIQAPFAGPVAPGPVSDGWASAPPSYPSASRGGDGVVPRPPPAPGPEGMPVSYVVASVFFLVIAAIGFGLWLAFAVISL